MQVQASHSKSATCQLTANRELTLLPRGCGSPAHDTLPWAYHDSGNQVVCTGFIPEMLHTYDARVTSRESEVSQSRERVGRWAMCC